MKTFIGLNDSENNRIFIGDHLRAEVAGTNYHGTDLDEVMGLTHVEFEIVDNGNEYGIEVNVFFCTVDGRVKNSDYADKLELHLAERLAEDDRPTEEEIRHGREYIASVRAVKELYMVKTFHSVHDSVSFYQNFIHVKKSKLTKDSERVEFKDKEHTYLPFYGDKYTLKDKLILSIPDDLKPTILERAILMKDEDGLLFSGDYTHLALELKSERGDPFCVDFKFIPCDENGNPTLYEYVRNKDKYSEKKENIMGRYREEWASLESADLTDDVRKEKTKDLFGRKKADIQALELDKDCFDLELVSDFFINLYSPMRTCQYLVEKGAKLDHVISQ